MTDITILISIVIMAVVTYATRVLPLVIFKKKIKNRYIKSFLLYMPYGVLAAMVFPAVIYSTSFIISAIVGMIVALLLAFFQKGLLPVAFFSCLSVMITELLIKIL